MSDMAGCCAHLTVKYDPIKVAIGAYRANWKCQECGHVFYPHAETAQKRIAELEAVLKSVDDLRDSEAGLREELIACDLLKWDSPVLVIHRKIRELLNCGLRIVKEGE